MTVLSVELPADVAADIEKMAEELGTTPARQAEILLRYSLGNYPRKESLLEAAIRIAAMTPAGAKQVPSEVLIRESRDL